MGSGERYISSAYMVYIIFFRIPNYIRQGIQFSIRRIHFLLGVVNCIICILASAMNTDNTDNTKTTPYRKRIPLLCFKVCVCWKFSDIKASAR